MLKKATRMFFAGFLLCVCILAVSSPASAATQKAKALKAYAEFLSEKKIALTTIFGEDNASAKFKTAGMKFAIIYLNRDSIPELVVDNTANITGNYYSPFGTAVFTWVDGEVQQVCIQDTNYKLLKYYKKKGVLTLASRVKSKLTVTAYMDDDEQTAIAVKYKTKFYGPEYLSGVKKKISKAKYRRLIKKVVGSRKATTIKYRDNTEANRTKYLVK